MAATRSAMSSSSRPAIKERRSRSDVSNSSSPCMARAVMAETCGPTPARIASSSMHSCAIIVESMSATSRRLRRPAAGMTAISRGNPGNSSRRASSRPAAAAPVTISHASSAASQRRALAPTKRLTFSAMAGRPRTSGLAIRTTTLSITGQ